MKNKKHQLGILLAATQESIFTLGTMIVNIKAIMQVDIFYIVSNHFKTADIEAMQKVAAKSEIRFINFTKESFKANLNRHSKTPINLNKNHCFLSRWTFMAFACFEGLKLLEECENIIYLDFDILLLRGLEHFLKYKKSGYALAAHRGRTSMRQTMGYASEYGELCVYCSGIIYYNTNLENPLKIYEELYEWFGANPLNCNDQAGLSYIIFKNKIKVKNLGYGYTGSVHYRANDKPHIIHAFGPKNRFWNNQLTARLWPQWNKYYTKWLEAGGSAYKGGFVAKTTYSYERMRYHLSYKLGYAIVRNHESFLGKVKLPFLLIQIAMKHKKEAKKYKKNILKNPHLILPPISTYEDYKNALKEKQSVSYRLGESLIKGYQNWYKGGFLDFFRELRKAYIVYKKQKG